MSQTYLTNDSVTYVSINFNAEPFKQAQNKTEQDKFVQPSTNVCKENIDTIGPAIRTVQDVDIGTTQPSHKQSENVLRSQKTFHVNKVLVFVVIILTAFGLVLGMLYFTKDQKVNKEVSHTAQTTKQTNFNTTESVTTKSPFETFPNPARTCVELRDAGYQDGIYVIQPSLKPFEVYCDMVAAGGGWILAATINNNSFNSNDTYGGSWFLMTSNNHQNYSNNQNWTNRNSFGTFDTCTRSDFKSQAYYEYQGKDIMLRHVPNQTPLQASRKQSFLQYQTQNGFMKNYGGNLHKIYNKHYPLKPTSAFYPDVNLMLDRLAAKSTEITNLVSEFYFYDYGTLSNSLYDNNLYGRNGGMRINYGITQSCYRSLYHANYRDCGLQYELDYGAPQRCDLGNTILSSRKTHPFFALFAVGNFDRCSYSTYLWVISDRPSTDSIVLYKGNHTLNNFFSHYEAQCRNEALYASLCDVWFYVINTEDWNSPGTPTIGPYNYAYGREYSFGWKVYKAESNTLFGYTMITRENATLITESEINAVTHKILEIISGTNNFCPNCSYDDVLSQPVQFSIGNDSVVNSMLPPSVKPLPTGFVQFRAYGKSGSVYAICPAVKVNDWKSEFVCIGGMKNPDSYYLDDCNDFTNWNGLPRTSLHETTPVDYAHSWRDLNSTIMIFYR